MFSCLRNVKVTLTSRKQLTLSPGMKLLQLSSFQMGPNPDQKCIRNMLQQKGAQCLVFGIKEMHWAPFCWSMFRIHFWSGFGPIWRDESCNNFIPGLSVSCFRDVNVTLMLRKQLNITAGVLSQDHT